jgi:hypothetical protein
MFDAKQVKKMKREMIRDFNSRMDSIKNDFKSFITHMSLEQPVTKVVRKVSKKGNVKAKLLGRPKKVA